MAKSPTMKVTVYFRRLPSYNGKYFIEGGIRLELRDGEYLVSDDKSLLQLPVICGFLARSYWASNRSEATIRKAVENSVCYGLYRGDAQVGFARIVTDGATVYYLCDVYIDERERGKGLGKKLVAAIVREYEGIPGLLGTRDAHGLYEQYGFRKEPERFMRRTPGQAGAEGRW